MAPGTSGMRCSTIGGPRVFSHPPPVYLCSSGMSSCVRSLYLHRSRCCAGTAHTAPRATHRLRRVLAVLGMKVMQKGLGQKGDLIFRGIRARAPVQLWAFCVSKLRNKVSDKRRPGFPGFRALRPALAAAWPLWSQSEAKLAKLPVFRPALGA